MGKGGSCSRERPVINNSDVSFSVKGTKMDIAVCYTDTDEEKGQNFLRGLD